MFSTVCTMNISNNDFLSRSDHLQTHCVSTTAADIS